MRDSRNEKEEEGYKQVRKINNDGWKVFRKKSKRTFPENRDTDQSDDDDGGIFYINRKTLPLKITLFLFYGAMSAILPYLTIHMKDIGISLSEIAIIYAVLPFTAFLGPPIMGFMADKMGQYKAVLVVATVINGLAHTLLLLVPKYSETMVLTPAIIEFNIGNGSIHTAVLKPTHISHCHQFIVSLANRKRHGSNDGMFNVHSCSSDEAWNQANNKNNIGRRILVPQLQWRIPNYCQYSTQVNTEDSLEAVVDLHDSIHCEYREDRNPARMDVVTGSTNSSNRSTRSIAPEPSCYVRINLIGEVLDPDLDPIQQQITCQTNYTFPTGEVVKHGNGLLTFWLYFLIRIIGNIFMAACFSLLDATTLAVVEVNKGAEYGKERILSVVGYALVSPLAGLLVDVVSSSKGYTDYSSAFYVANAMLCVNIVGYFFMELDVEKPEDDMWQNATALLNYPEVIVFLAMIFIMGNMWGFVESYLFIFLDELHAPKYLLGLTLTVGSLASVPFLFWAEGMVAKVGRVNIIVLAFLVYFVRCFGYSFIPNPFWCFPFEAMEAFTYHLMWVAAATYCAILSPKGLLGTLTGVMGSLHYGLGKGSGAFIGGYVINMSSSRMAFRYFGVFAGVMGLIYFLINILWLESAIRKRNEREVEQIPDENEQKQSMLRIDKKENTQIV